MGKKYYGLRGSWLNITIGFIAGLDFLLFGYDQGVTGGLLKLDSFRHTFPEIDPYQFECKDPASTAQQFSCPEGDKLQYQKYSVYQGELPPPNNHSTTPPHFSRIITYMRLLTATSHRRVSV